MRDEYESTGKTSRREKQPERTDREEKSRQRGSDEAEGPQPAYEFSDWALI